ncbi:MAG: metal ABC transporter solute-binding protein, Zn/Mn family [Candidatus Dormibacteria bacterium]
MSTWRHPVHRGRRGRQGLALILGGVVGAQLLLGSAALARAQPLRVVAAENFWGSLARQLGGSRVQVTSIVTDPNADPHEYESSSADAQAFASARVVIINGAGYDDWARRLLSAQSEPGRRVLAVAHLLHRSAGENPHFWYSPGDVFRVVDQITRDYRAAEPAAAAYFASRHAAVERALAPYRSQLTYLRGHFAGTPVGATESIFQYLATYLHLRLVTPVSFMQAVSEGIDPPAASVATFDRQIAGKRFRVLVYNRQTISPLTSGLRQQALAKGIPVVAVSETIDPPRLSFEAWMGRQLSALTRALRRDHSGP